MANIFVNLNESARVCGGKTPLILSIPAFKKIAYWSVYASREHKREVSGLGTATKRYGGIFVSNVWLIAPSEVSGGHVHQDPAAIGALMQKLYYGTGVLKSGGATFEGGKDMKNLRFLWHSHANFNVHWSPTDDTNAKFDFCPDSQWTVNLVTNEAGNYLARQDFPASNHKLRQTLSSKDYRIMPSTTQHDLPVRLLVQIRNNEAERFAKIYEEDHRKFRPSTVQEVDEPISPLDLFGGIARFNKPEEPNLFDEFQSLTDEDSDAV